MNYIKMRDELRDFYLNKSKISAVKFMTECKALLDDMYNEDMSVYEMKAMQYNVISDNCRPILFENSPFYYETGVIPSYSDGSRSFRGLKHAGGWTYEKNEHLFLEQDLDLWRLKCDQQSELFYLICGPYNDTDQHFMYKWDEIFKVGFKGIYKRVQKQLEGECNKEEREFLETMCEGILCVKKICEKFSLKAQEMLVKDPENENMQMIAESAARCPWEKPQNFYEAINSLLLMCKIIGSLEGVGVNTFGRVDLELYPFYENDIKKGALTKEKAYELICQFLLSSDCTYDHDMKMVGYADHELEKTYVLGGCDKDGNIVFNDLTRMFLKATDEEKIIFPKIKCRFSQNSPKEYLDLINSPVIKGTSTILYQNDDAVISALVKNGRTLEESRDYITSGCWDINTNCNDCKDCGTYVNLLKVFECEIHNRQDIMKKVNMQFEIIDDAASFEEVYNITLHNFEILIKERARVIKAGGQIWSKVDVVPLYSAIMDDCIGSKKDYTNHGTKYKDEVYMIVGVPNIVDSLMVIKKLCFDEKKHFLSEILKAVRCNWDEFEDIRVEAMHCSGWGDGDRESCELMARLNSDLYKILSGMESVYGGRIHLGHVTYTEIRFWGEKTLATPDGRKNGEYFAQGLTPSRLKKIPSVTSVINSMAALDKSDLSGNNVINIILPGTTSLDICEAFIRTCAGTSVESLQLNCVSKATLLDAQKNPEKYPDLIVRVCGFSAKFTSLSPEWQQEVLTRNFYEG